MRAKSPALSAGLFIMFVVPDGGLGANSSLALVQTEINLLFLLQHVRQFFFGAGTGKVLAGKSLGRGKRAGWGSFFRRDSKSLWAEEQKGLDSFFFFDKFCL